MPTNELHKLCKEGPSKEKVTVAKLKEMLTREPKLAEEKDDDGKTPFVLLCGNNDVTHEMIEVFLNLYF